MFYADDPVIQRGVVIDMSDEGLFIGVGAV